MTLPSRKFNGVEYFRRPQIYHTKKDADEAAKLRSRTFEGIAEAMAEQWDEKIDQNKLNESRII